MQGSKRFIFPNELLGNQEYVDTMKASITSSIQQWQQQHPAGSPLDLFEAVKATAVVNTQLWHAQFKQRQQQQRRHLWMAVKTAKSQLQHFQPDAQLTAALLAAEQRLTDHDTAAAERRRANGWFAGRQEG